MSGVPFPYSAPRPPAGPPYPQGQGWPGAGAGCFVLSAALLAAGASSVTPASCAVLFLLAMCRQTGRCCSPGSLLHIVASWAFWAHNAKRASNAPRAHNALVGQHPKPFERLTAAALSAFADAHENDFQKHKQGNTCFNQRKRATGPHRMKHPPAKNAAP